jgi:hypothetical protein
LGSWIRIRISVTVKSLNWIWIRITVKVLEL